MIEALLQDKYCTGDVEDKSQYPSQLINPDTLTEVAQKKGYITEEQKIHYYWVYSSCSVDYGPKKNGQFAILINKNRLQQFIQWYEGKSPRFDSEANKGTLSFLGNSLDFEGSAQVKSVSLLVENINSIVTKEEFFNIRDGKNYKNEVAKYGKGSANEAGETIFKKIKAKIDSNPNFSNKLVLIQKEGFGMFVNQRCLLNILHSDAEQSPEQPVTVPA